MLTSEKKLIFWDTICAYKKVPRNISLSDFCAKVMLISPFYNFNANLKRINFNINVGKSSINCSYNYYFHTLYIQFNLQKMILGTNSRFIDHAQVFQIMNHLNSIFEKIDPSIKIGEFIVSRADFGHNIYCQTPEEKQAYLEYFKRLPVSYSGYIDKYISSVVYQNRSKRFISYDKDEEMLYRENKMLGYCPNIFRIELQMKSSYIRRKYGKITLNKLIEMGCDPFQDFKSKELLSLKTLNKKDFYSTLSRLLEGHRKDFIKNAKKFFKYANKYGLQSAKNKFGKNSYYRFVNLFKSLGISPIFLPNSVENTSLISNLPKNQSDILMQYESVRKAKFRHYCARSNLTSNNISYICFT